MKYDIYHELAQDGHEGEVPGWYIDFFSGEWIGPFKTEAEAIKEAESRLDNPNIPEAWGIPEWAFPLMYLWMTEPDLELGGEAPADLEVMQAWAKTVNWDEMRYIIVRVFDKDLVDKVVTASDPWLTAAIKKRGKDESN